MMRLRSLTTFAVAASATFLAYGCAGDGPAAPLTERTTVAPPATQTSAAPQGPNESLGGLLGDVLGPVLHSPRTIVPITRQTPLASSQSVSKTIGVLGGTLVLPGAGLTVVVPPLAVLRPTKFTVTARAGSAVAYDFAPHGLKFRTPLVMLQNLQHVTMDKALLDLGLSLGYYPDADHITSITELLNVNVDLLHATAVSTIWHFSGYIYASGRSESSDAY